MSEEVKTTGKFKVRAQVQLQKADLNNWLTPQAKKTQTDLLHIFEDFKVEQQVPANNKKNEAQNYCIWKHTIMLSQVFIWIFTWKHDS